MNTIISNANGNSNRNNAAPAFAARDAADFLADDIKHKPLVEGLLDEAEPFAIEGGAKSRKHALALQGFVCLNAGVPFVGHEVRRARACLVCGDHSPAIAQQRLRNICAALNVAPEDLRGGLYIDATKGGVGLVGILDACKRQGCEVAIIDPLYQVADIDETDERACLDVVRLMRDFGREGIALGVVCHSPGGSGSGREVVGRVSRSAVISRFPESVISILPSGVDEAARVISVVRRGDTPLDPFAVKFEGGAFKVAPDISPEVATQRQVEAGDVLPYAKRAIMEAREDGGEGFVGMTAFALVEKVRLLMRADGKHSPGESRVKALLDLLPRGEVTRKRIGRAWYYDLAEVEAK